MKYLLDTQIFIWLDSNSSKLPDEVRDIITNRDNDLFLSLASIWEIQIKHQLGKLKLQIPLEDLVTSQQNNGVSLLGIQPQHIYMLSQLPMHHRDPFDRMIIAQSKFNALNVVSSDKRFRDYDVNVVWPKLSE